MTVPEESRERGSPSVPGVSNPVEDMGFSPICLPGFFFVPLCDRLWTGISVPHAEKVTCFATCEGPLLAASGGHI
jgi:hypothetical protein